jgi:hypothetical protein
VADANRVSSLSGLAATSMAAALAGSGVWTSVFIPEDKTMLLWALPRFRPDSGRHPGVVGEGPGADLLCLAEADQHSDSDNGVFRNMEIKWCAPRTGRCWQHLGPLRWLPRLPQSRALPEIAALNQNNGELVFRVRRGGQSSVFATGAGAIPGAPGR